MRKIFVFMMVSLDGFFEGPDHELDWHNVDAEFNKFASEQLNEADIPPIYHHFSNQLRINIVSISNYISISSSVSQILFSSTSIFCLIASGFSYSTS